MWRGFQGSPPIYTPVSEKLGLPFFSLNSTHKKQRAESVCTYIYLSIYKSI